MPSLDTIGVVGTQVVAFCFGGGSGGEIADSLRPDSKTDQRWDGSRMLTRYLCLIPSHRLPCSSLLGALQNVRVALSSCVQLGHVMRKRPNVVAL